MKKSAIIAVTLSILLAFSACSSQGSSADDTSTSSDSATNVNSSSSDNTNTTTELPVISTDGISADVEVKAGTVNCDEKYSTITFSDNTTCDDTDVTIEGSSVTIKKAGVYVVTGKTDDGMIIIDAGDEDKIELIFDGADINSAHCSPVFVKNADRVVINSSEGSVNRLANGGSFNEYDGSNVDSVIFSKEDLTLKGDGIIAVSSPAGHGIVSKKDINIKSGEYIICSSSHGINVKDSVDITGGSIKISSGKDGIHAQDSEDETKGSVTVADGALLIISTGDGIDTAGAFTVANGTVEIMSGGGNTTSATDETSCKGIKADIIDISDGVFTLDTADDSLHTSSSISISGGSFSIASGDDGIHADVSVDISGGSISIANSYEGIEAVSIDISGGEIYVCSGDDGLNACGGSNQFGGGFGGRGDVNNTPTDNAVSQASSSPIIKISGGKLTVNAQGDGVDSNGNLEVTGGEVYVSGPTQRDNGALDYQTSASITGGIVIAADCGGMSENFSEATQGSAIVSVGNQKAGTEISVTDADGNKLISFAPEKDYSTVVVSCPEMVQGGSYTITAGDSTQTITLDNCIYGSAFGFGNGGMQGGNHNQDKPGDFGNKPDNFGDIPDDFGERPDNFDKQQGEFGQRPDNFGNGFNGEAPNMPTTQNNS